MMQSKRRSQGDVDTENTPNSKESKLKRKGSDVSLISDLVKAKQITFLKSSKLFGEEEEIFKSPEKEEK